MGFPFERMVLVPAMAVFSDPIVLTPTASIPGAPAYLARGVYAVKQVTVRTDEGMFTDQQPTLGIKLADYPVPPKQGDSLVRTGVTWAVWDVRPDGQGGADVVLKETDPI